MKACPKCKKEYADEEIKFCLDDGATLIKKKASSVQNSRVNEVAAIGLLAFAVLAFLCLVSYSPSDPTFNTASSERVKNWIGFVGANFAELLISIAGSVAYLFPALLALIAWRVFQSQTLRPRVHRVIGFLLFVASASGLVSLMGWHGGIVGALFATYSVFLISSVGAAIFLIAAFIASLLLITDLSFLGIWGNVDVARENFKIHFEEWNEKRKKARAAAAELAKENYDRRRELREGVASTTTDSPTITIGDGARTRAYARDTVAVARDTSAKTSEVQATVSDEASKTATETIIEEKVNGEKSSKLPNIDFLNQGPEHIAHDTTADNEIAKLIEKKSKEFNVSGVVKKTSPGPVVTTFEFKPDAGVKYARVTGLADDLCMALEAESIRIDRIPGKAHVGIEVPNKIRSTIYLRDVIDSEEFRNSQSPLTLALGKTVSGENYVTDLASMPHLLIAGATGAGKSVGVNTLVVSILYKATPNDVKFIMVDPKRLELGLYKGIPHLNHDIITEPKKAANALRWAVREMEKRYKILAHEKVRNIAGFNSRNGQKPVEVNGGNVGSTDSSEVTGEDKLDIPKRLPYIVIIIDELADLMMVSGKEVEESITRLAQMARAVGIHLVLATQRPSVDVITGLIKANFPARISFRVSSKVDSRTIIDSNGAESLLGRGDMLFLPPATSSVIRVHGAYVDETEIEKIVNHVRKEQGEPEFDTTITENDDESQGQGDLPGRKDPLFSDALNCVVNAKRGSTSLLQRHLRIGYGRAAAILDAMVKEGYIGDMDGSSRARPVLQKAYEDVQDLSEQS